MISHSAFLEINLKNIIFNYKYLSSLYSFQKTGATIKANAYGLGDREIIKILFNNGCKHFFVATMDEAKKIRKNFNYGYIYVLNGINKNEFNFNLVKNKIIPIINTIKNYNEIKKYKKKIDIGIHIDTGINRLGIPLNDLNKFKYHKNINIILILSHLASADQKKNHYNNKQLIVFNKLTKKYFKPCLKSLSNSGGMVLGKNFQFDIARPGIALYGGHNNTSLKHKIKPVIKLKAKILQIKKINKNEYIGYNQTFRTKKKMTIAIIGIGYADGILRKLSNIGYVYYKNYKFKIIGRISMDTITVDISNKAKILKAGLFIDIINYEHDIEKIAKSCGTISNEILTSFTSNRIKKIYKN